MNNTSVGGFAGFALAAGFIAAFNPCGFAMMPAYLSYFLGFDADQKPSQAQNILRGLKVGLTLCAGFLLVFGVVGLLAATVLDRGALGGWTAWVTFGLGIALGILGLAMLIGFQLKINLPRFQKGGDTRKLTSIFLFGVSYAIVSLGCTLPIFFGTVVLAFTSRNFGEGLLFFLAYGGGLSIVILVLTLGMALARNEIVGGMRRLLPHINRISGVFLVLVGAFLAVYGWWEVLVFRGELTNNFLVDLSGELQMSLTNWANAAAPSRLAVASLFIMAGVILWALRTDWKPITRKIVLGAFLLTWVLIEIIAYRWDLFVLPVLRTIADVPFRIGNWFADPLRWSTLFEVLTAIFVGFIIYWRIKKRLERKKADMPPEEERLPPRQTLSTPQTTLSEKRTS